MEFSTKTQELIRNFVLCLMQNIFINPLHNKSKKIKMSMVFRHHLFGGLRDGLLPVGFSFLQALASPPSSIRLHVYANVFFVLLLHLILFIRYKVLKFIVYQSCRFSLPYMYSFLYFSISFHLKLHSSELLLCLVWV